MNPNHFENFLKIQEFYKLKQVSRNSSNNYYDEKDGIYYKRRETVSEHVQSCIKLANFFIFTEEEFYSLNRLRVHDLLDHHDDVEIITGDIGISERIKRIKKEELELKGRLIFAERLPKKLDKFYLDCDKEYREKISDESKFANGIDKWDSLVHEFQYPLDWGPKGFDEKNVREWFQPAFNYSPTFLEYFEATIHHLKNQGYFNK